jgi:type II secretory ATPase GspE/PulE/Tfp pilus assembly ATPase PilB-like protein/nucleotide-binding universal stress UspA family protein
MSGTPIAIRATRIMTESVCTQKLRLEAKTKAPILMSINTIVVPYDFSSKSILALEKACQLGSQLQAELHLVYVKEGVPDADLQRHAMDRLLKATPPSFELQNKVHREVLIGSIHDELVEYAKRCQADLIIMGTHGRTGILQLTLGSLAQRVLSEAPCPVVLVKEDMIDAEPVRDQADIQYQRLKDSESPAIDLLARAIGLRATDIHIDPLDKEQYSIRFRIDGSVVSYCTVDPGVAEHLMHQYLTLARIDTADPFHPREGRLLLPPSMHEFETRVTATPVAGGEAMSLRLFSKDNVFLPLESLGFGSSGLKTVQEMLHGSEGLVLVTGPTGSGKTTTVYSMLQTYGSTNKNIVSIEDPVEFDVPFVRQLNVDERHGVTMTSGLRTILRMDPDIIFVGEIRDPENAAIALRAASSGRYVFSSLHTRDVASTFTAFRDLGVLDHSMTVNLIGVVNQRLVRRLCAECRKIGELSPKAEAIFCDHCVDVPTVVYEPVGCDFCRGTGSRGRCGVFECVRLDADLIQAIDNNECESELRRLIRSKGIDSLTSEALKKVADGVTSFDEAISVRWLL